MNADSYPKGSAFLLNDRVSCALNSQVGLQAPMVPVLAVFGIGGARIPRM